MPSKPLSFRIHMLWTSQHCMSVKKIKYSLLDCLGLKIHFKLLMLWLKFYYRSCLTRQIFLVIYIFPLLTELIALHLSFWDCLFKSFFNVLSHYSTPGTTYKLLPLLIFSSKKQPEKLLRGGEGERRTREREKKKTGCRSCPGHLSWPPPSLGPHILSCTSENLSQMLLSPPGKDVQEGEAQFWCLQRKALTVSSSDTQILNLYMDTMRRLKEISK